MSSVLITSIIFALSELTMNNIFNDTISTFVKSTSGYEFPPQFFLIEGGKSLSLMLRKMQFQELTVSDYEISLISPDTIDVSINEINAVLYFDWEYSIGGISDNGEALISIQGLSFTAEVIMQDQKMVKATAGNVKADIEDLTITIQRPSNLNSNWVFSMFKKDISELLCNSLENSITDVINSLDLSPMYYVLTDSDIAFDYSLSKPPQVTSSMFQLSSLGIFIQDSHPNYNPPIPIPSAATIQTVPGMQFVFTDYTINSLSYSGFVLNYYEFNITNNNLPESFPFTLTTTTLGLFIPGLIDEYGSGKDIEIYCNFQEQPEFRFLEELEWNVQIEMDGYLICKVLVEVDEALVLGMAVSGNGKFSLEDWKLQGEVNYIQVDTIDVIVNKVNADTDNVKDFINSALETYVSTLNNDYFTNGIDLPSNDRFNLNNSMIKSGNGFMYLLVNPKITFEISDLYN